jgi:hypothetical protein
MTLKHHHLVIPDAAQREAVRRRSGTVLRTPDRRPLSTTIPDLHRGETAAVRPG